MNNDETAAAMREVLVGNRHLGVDGASIDPGFMFYDPSIELTVYKAACGVCLPTQFFINDSRPVCAACAEALDVMPRKAPITSW